MYYHSSRHLLRDLSFIIFPCAGWQASVSRVPASSGAIDQFSAWEPPNFVIFCHISSYSEVIQRPIFAEALCNQPHGRADFEGYHTVLRVCGREAEGSLPEYFVLQGTSWAFNPRYEVRVQQMWRCPFQSHLITLHGKAWLLTSVVQSLWIPLHHSHRVIVREYCYWCTW